MSKTPKFLLCENPIAEKSDGRVFILHMREPKIIAEIFSFEEPILESELNELKSKFTTGATLTYGTEYFVFGAIWIEESDKIDLENRAQELASIMRRMADWYEAYLNWEDSNDEE